MIWNRRSGKCADEIWRVKLILAAVEKYCFAGCRVEFLLALTWSGYRGEVFERISDKSEPLTRNLKDHHHYRLRRHHQHHLHHHHHHHYPQSSSSSSSFSSPAVDVCPCSPCVNGQFARLRQLRHSLACLPCMISSGLPCTVTRHLSGLITASSVLTPSRLVGRLTHDDWGLDEGAALTEVEMDDELLVGWDW